MMSQRTGDNGVPTMFSHPGKRRVAENTFLFADGTPFKCCCVGFMHLAFMQGSLLLEAMPQSRPVRNRNMPAKAHNGT
jgi:hypothetical protein